MKQGKLLKQDGPGDKKVPVFQGSLLRQNAASYDINEMYFFNTLSKIFTYPVISITMNIKKKLTFMSHSNCFHEG